MKWASFGLITLLVGCVSLTSGSASLHEAEQRSEAQDRIWKLLDRLDENPDILHSDYTPAVSELIELGKPAIMPTLPYLLSQDDNTRLHAIRVIDGSILKIYGFNRGQGWTSEIAEEDYMCLCATMPRYKWRGNSKDYESEFEERLAYVVWITKWHASQNE